MVRVHPGSLVRAAGPKGRCRLRTPEIGVQVPGGPLTGDRKAAIRQLWALESVGSIPTPLTAWADGRLRFALGNYQRARNASGVVRPLRKVAGYGWPGRSAK